jgi:hypothetical protein
MKRYTPYTLPLLATLLLSGCSYKTSEFFEDLFAENRVVKAEGQYKGSVNADAHAPIIGKKEKKSYKQDKRVYSYRGKIAAVHFDKDFNLYVYTFIDHITHKPITFFYDKNIKHNRYKGDYRVRVSGNYLIAYEQLDAPKKSKIAKEKDSTKRSSTIKKYKRRKRSSIKVPVEEKINPL